MSKSKSIFHFDQIEQKVVFRVSRTFFWVFVTIAGLSFVAAVFVLLYSIIPSSKENVIKAQYPEKPKVTTEEILAALTPPLQSPKSEEPTQQVTQPSTQPVQEYKESVDSLQLKIIVLMDSLGTFIKSGWGITYESYIIGYDWFNRPSYGTRARYGLKSDLENILSKFYEIKEDKIAILQSLVNVMPKIKEDMRENSLRYFMRSIRNKWEDYRSAIDRIESDYNIQTVSAEIQYANAKLKKAELGNKAIITIGGAIVLMSLLGLILCFMAIERNTRAVKELLEREKKSEEK